MAGKGTEVPQRDLERGMALRFHPVCGKVRRCFLLVRLVVHNLSASGSLKFRRHSWKRGHTFDSQDHAQGFGFRTVRSQTNRASV